MKVSNILKNIKIIKVLGDINTEVFSLSQKVENCNEGCLFFCYKGVNFDGHEFVNQAVLNGATCIVCERPIKNCKVLQVVVKNVRDIIFKVCNNFYNNITKKFKFIGVTGTNGKTTCATIIKNIINYAKRNCCLIGTNGVEINNLKFKSNLTTPDTVNFFEILNEASKYNVEYVVMEVSAHALALKKIKGLKFEVGIFTNLTQDHLDYFKSLHNYALTKLKFLKKSYCKNVVINTDDKYGKLFYKLTNANIFTYGINEPAQNFAIDINLSKTGSSFLVNILNSVAEVKTNLICKFNIYNILSCCVCAKILGFDMDTIVNGINQIKKINGRLNQYNLKKGSVAIIDYAHTPDGLEKVLENLRLINPNGKILTIFGCGGNRDKDKRYKMGQIAEVLSDEVFITNDNPRYENENEIIRDILNGIKTKVFIDTNRENTIKTAIEKSKKGDIILIAGKGCETYQEIKGKKIPFSDEKIVLEYC